MAKLSLSLLNNLMRFLMNFMSIMLSELIRTMWHLFAPHFMDEVTKGYVNFD